MSPEEFFQDNPTIYEQLDTLSRKVGGPITNYPALCPNLSATALPKTRKFLKVKRFNAPIAGSL